VCNLYKCNIYSYSRFLVLRLYTNMVLIIVVDLGFNHFVVIFYYYNTSSLVSIICLFIVWSETIIGINIIHLFQMKPTMCTLFLSTFISTSLHVSGNYVPIIRRTFCNYATLAFFNLYEWLTGLLVGMRLRLIAT